MTTTREALHRLVDRLPDANLPAAAEALATIASPNTLDAATEARIREGIAAADRGDVVPASEVLAELRAGRSGQTVGTSTACTVTPASPDVK